MTAISSRDPISPNFLSALQETLAKAAAAAELRGGRDALLRVRGPAGAGPYQRLGFRSWKLRLLYPALPGPPTSFAG